MREILFKAKRLDNGEWVEGYLFCVWKRAYILWGTTNDVPNMIEVDAETICQYTGLTDKNGKKIWENDVVRFEDTGEDGYEYSEGFDFVNMAQVVFADGRWQLNKFLSDNSYVLEEMYDHVEFKDFWKYAEVIGNIFDNPELLEGGADHE